MVNVPSDEGSDGGEGPNETFRHEPPSPDQREPVSPAAAAVARERAEVARKRAEAARERASSARERADDVHAQIDATGSGQAEAAAGPEPAHADEVFVDRVRQLAAHGESLRAAAAQLSESMADEAEKFADHLEHSAVRGDRERRLAMASVERRIAGIERRNAQRLRGVYPEHSRLESLPDLPGFPLPGKGTSPPSEEDRSGDQGTPPAAAD